MKQLFILLGIGLALMLLSCQQESRFDDNKSLSLNYELLDYFEPQIPFNGNSFSNGSSSDELASFGRLLFYDVRLSKNNSISCASCHNQTRAFTDNQQFSAGLENYTTSRNAMTLVNNAYQISHFWEGHTGNMDDHILSPISNHIEMGMKSVDELVSKLSQIETYDSLSQVVFNKIIDEDLIRQSLATFVASLVSYNTKFDQGVNIDFNNFTATEKAGKDLFFGKAKCGQCHKNQHFTATWRRSANIGLDLEYQDEGAGAGHFKVPSLRNIGLTAPYMHDGRFSTLSEVINHYNEGIQDHPELDWALTNGIELTQTEQEDLEAFLHTLTDYVLISDARFSNPFF